MTTRVPSSHESQDVEDLLGAIKVTRPHRFKLSDSVSKALRSPAALEADEEEGKEEDKLPDSPAPSQVGVGVANVIDAHPGK